jgi:hypothetical protein
VGMSNLLNNVLEEKKYWGKRNNEENNIRRSLTTQDDTHTQRCQSERLKRRAVRVSLDRRATTTVRVAMPIGLKSGAEGHKANQAPQP